MLFYCVTIFVIFVQIQLSFSFESAELTQLIKDCAEKNNIQADDFDKVDWSNPEEVDETYLCTMKCFFQSTDVVRRDSSFNVDVYIELLGEMESSKSESAFDSISSQEIMDCLNGISHIETCADIKKIIYCDPYF